MLSSSVSITECCELRAAKWRSSIASFFLPSPLLRPTTQTMKIEPFNPEIPQERIEDLRKRLDFQKDDKLTAGWEGERERFGE